MRRGTILLLALLFVAALAATAYAVPLLVELKISDPLTVVSTSPATSDDITGGSQGKGNGKSGDSGKSGDKGSSGDHGKPDDPLSQANLKALTLWLSTDGKSWKALDAEITNLGSDKITAKFGSKGKDSIDPMSLGLPASDVAGSGDSYYIGVSTSSTSFTGTAYSARLVSWQVASKTDASTSVPEPVLWPLIVMGAIGAGFALRRPKKA